MLLVCYSFTLRSMAITGAVACYVACDVSGALLYYLTALDTVCSAVAEVLPLLPGPCGEAHRRRRHQDAAVHRDLQESKNNPSAATVFFSLYAHAPEWGFADIFAKVLVIAMY